MAATDQLNTVVVVPRGRDEPQWQGTPQAAETLYLLTAGGKPFNKLWRYDYVPDPVWTGTPQPSDTLFQLTANGPPTRPRQWRWDYDPPPVWLADPVPTNIRTFPAAAAPAKLWRSDYDPAPPWQGYSEAANYLLLGGQVKTRQWGWDQAPDPAWVWRPPPNEPLYQPAGKPFAKQWRADFDVDTRSWQWEPANVTIGLPVPSLLGAGALFAQDADPDTRLWQWRAPPVASIPAPAKPFSRQWRWDQTPDPVWTWPPQPTDTLYLLTAGGKPFGRQWRYDHVPDPVWLGEPQPSNIGTFPASVKPFSRLARFHYAVDQEPAWLGVPVASPFELPSVTGTPFNRQWRYDYVPDAVWLGEPQPSNIFAFPTGSTKSPFYAPRPDFPAVWQGEPQPSNTGILPGAPAPFSKLWRWDFTPDPVWLGEPQPSNVETFPVSIKPFSRLWRRDHVPDPVWQGEPQAANIGTLPAAAAPFSRQWRYDHVPDPAWIWTPPPSDPLRLLTAGGEPFSRLWRYDYVPDALWQGAPVSVPIETFPAVSLPFGRLWRYDLTPSPDWTWQAPGSPALRALTAGGAPAHRLWRYDYDSGAAFWQGVPLVTNITTLVQTAPFHQQWRYDWDSGRSWWQGAPIGVNVPIANPGPPVPVVPPTTGAGGELPPGYRWRWTDFNDRAWLKAFRDEFYRLRRLKNPERRRRQFEVLEQKFIGAAERALEYETPYEKKLDLVQLGELLQGFATPASFDRIEMYLVALAAEIDDEEAFLLLND